VADLRFDLHGTDAEKTIRIRDLLTWMYRIDRIDRIDRMVGRKPKLWSFMLLSLYPVHPVYPCKLKIVLF
jgi:hypothetical protein